MLISTPAIEVSPDDASLVRFLKQSEEKDLLRFTTAGSVDDGKSTLIGRLLFDSKGVYEDQVASARKATVNQTAGKLDFALLTDGLRAEREQGITIDVAYRYFATVKRKFIIADTPGHEQYTRNMATGASTANLAVVLVDATRGVLVQSRRHAFIATLLGIPHLVVAVNKMDLVGYSEDVFEQIRAEFSAFAADLQVPDVHFVPISALNGDNVVEPSRHMPWFDGGTLLHHLETAHIASDRNLTELRFPVQYVLRPDASFRGYAGQLASGQLRPGDPIMVLPSGKTSKVKSIVSYDGNLSRAFPPMSITVCLEDELDVSRGDMLVHPMHAPRVSRTIDARLVWMDERPLEVGREYLLKQTTQTVRAKVVAIRYRIDVNTLEKEAASELRLNDIGAVVIQTNRPLFVDPYRRNRATGAMILIDALSNMTAAAGMITGRRPDEVQKRPVLDDVQYGDSRVTMSEREARTGHKPVTIWLHGSEDLAFALERQLFDLGCMVNVLVQGRDPVPAAELASAFNAAGLITILDAPRGSEEERDKAANIVGHDRFFFFDAPDLPATRAEAVEFVCETLRSKRILPPRSG
jgi:sulfate adenylyltransferase large subunit